jgi:ribose 5-phosphate isomerase B
MKNIALGCDDWDEFCEEIVGFQNEYYKVTEKVRDPSWVQVGFKVATLVAHGKVDFGVVCCYTGTGVSIAANKIKGVRAALCCDVGSAEGARRYNDANVLALSQRLIGKGLKFEILQAFMTNGPDESEIININLLKGK